MNKAFRFLIIGITCISIYACGSKKAPTGGAVDTVKPTILSSLPEEYGDISEGKIELTFSKPLDKASITQGIYIYPPIDAKKITYAPNTITIRILEKLQDNTNYYVTLTSRIKDTHDIAMESNQTIIYRNGKLSDRHISGNLIYEKTQDNGKPISLSLLSADSLMIISKVLSGNTYTIDALNPGIHILRAYIDLNSNGRYDFSKEPYFEGKSNDREISNLDINLAYADTTMPSIRGVKAISNREIEIDFSEELSSYDRLNIVRNADQKLLPARIVNFEGDRIFILTEEADTSRYTIHLDNATDLKGNASKVIRYPFNGTSRADDTAPTVTYTNPRRGTSVNTLRPEIEVHFSEIIPAANFRYSLQASDSKDEIPVELTQKDRRIYKLKPKKDLQNYKTYYLVIKADTADISGNKLGTDYSLEFLPLYRH